MEQVYLLVSAGGGPMECRLAVGHVLARMRREAEGLGVDVSYSTDDKAPDSALIALAGAGSRLMAVDWIGTVQWRQASQLRPGHRRANWFVGVFDLPSPTSGPGSIPLAEVQFSSFRAGGPGGQHQNTTDSAVRAVWRSFSAVSRDGRSQHQNKAKALERLQALVQAAKAEALAGSRADAHARHRQLERGNPKRVFIGPDFVETERT
jgi:peptide chain release factor